MAKKAKTKTKTLTSKAMKKTKGGEAVLEKRGPGGIEPRRY
jgi:hypothetical protein